jgi:hypothetical protein
MSAKVVEICSPWQQVADASDRIAELISDIPAGHNGDTFEGFELTEESQKELRLAAALLQRVIPLLRPAVDREEPRYSKHMERLEEAQTARDKRPH